MNLVMTGATPATVVIVLALLGLAILLVWLLARTQQAVAELQQRVDTEFDRGHTAGKEFLLGELDDHISDEAERRKKLWLVEEAPKVREDAIKRSAAAMRGKAAEHLAPFSSDWRFDPDDARFLGGLIDFIVFEGVTEGCIEHIWFIEVKAGKRARLSKRQRQVKKICELGKVGFKLFHVRDDGETTP